MRRYAPIAWLVLGLAACNAIAGLDGDFAEGDGGGAIVSPEAGASSGTSSSGTSGTTSSSGEPSDAGDAGDADAADANDGGARDADAAPLPLCTTQGLFCDDFETTRPAPSFGWSAKEENGVGTVDFVADNGALPGVRAMRARITSPGSSTDRTVMLVRQIGDGTDLDDVGESLTLELDFKISAMSTDYLAVAAIRVNYKEYGLAAYRPTSNGAGCPGLQCLDQTTPVGQPAFLNATALTLGVWRHAVIKVARVTDDYSGSVTVDGLSLDARPSGAFATTAVPSKDQLDVVAGAFYAGTPQNAAVLIDNVKVTRP